MGHTSIMHSIYIYRGLDHKTEFCYNTSAKHAPYICVLVFFSFMYQRSICVIMASLISSTVAICVKTNNLTEEWLSNLKKILGRHILI